MHDNLVTHIGVAAQWESGSGRLVPSLAPLAHLHILMQSSSPINKVASHLYVHADSLIDFNSFSLFSVFIAPTTRQ
jgi:hypothetical protein